MGMVQPLLFIPCYKSGCGELRGVTRRSRNAFEPQLAYNYCFRPDINWVKVYYSLFRGVKHNIRFEFKDKKNYREKQEFMNNYKRA